MECLVHPELTIRSAPWQFWGRVHAFQDDAVIFVEIRPTAEGVNYIRIPYRYFHDKRVYRTEAYT